MNWLGIIVLILHCIIFTKTIMASDCGGPPPFPDMEVIFQNTLKSMQKIEDLHRRIKLEKSTPNGIYETNCSCGYTNYMNNIANLTDKLCDSDIEIERSCNVITTQGVVTTTVAETTQPQETTVPILVKSTKPPVVPPGKISSPVVPTGKPASPVVPTGKPASPATRSSNISTGRVVTGASTIEASRRPAVPTVPPTDQPRTTSVEAAIPGAQRKADGVDVVLISVLGGVVAFIIIVMAFFICRRRILGKKESKPLTRKPTDQRPLTARSVSMLSESSMYENGSVSIDDLIFRTSTGEAENGSVNGYVISKLRRDDSLGHSSVGANSTRLLLRQESEIASPPTDDKAFHFNTLRATDLAHGTGGGFGETCTDKTLTLNRKNKKKDLKKGKDRRRSWGSGSCSSATSSKKGSDKKKAKNQPPSIIETKFRDDDLDDNVFMNAAFVGDSGSNIFRPKAKEPNNNLAKVTDVNDIDIGPDGSSTPKSYRSSASFHDDSLSQSNMSYNSQFPSPDNHSVNTTDTQNTSIVLNGLNDALRGFDTDSNSFNSNSSVVNSPKIPRFTTSDSVLPNGYSTLPSAKRPRSFPDPPAQFRDPEPLIARVKPSNVKKTGQWTNPNLNSHHRNSVPDFHAPVHNGSVTRISIGNTDLTPQEVHLNPGNLVIGYSSLGRPSNIRLANGKPAARVIPQIQHKTDSNLSLDKPAPVDVKL